MARVSWTVGGISNARRLASAAVVAAVLLPQSSMGEVIDRVVAVVAGDLIMLSDVILARDLGLIARSGGVAQLIDRTMILSEVSRYAPPEPPPEAVDRELERLRSSLATRESFDLVLARGGIDEERLRERLRQDLRISAYIDRRFAAPPPSEDEIRGFYADHPERFRRDGAVVPLDDVRAEIVSALTSDRRRELVEEWLGGLRRRVAILDLSDGAP